MLSAAAGISSEVFQCTIWIKCKANRTPSNGKCSCFLIASGRFPQWKQEQSVRQTIEDWLLFCFPHSGLSKWTMFLNFLLHTSKWRNFLVQPIIFNWSFLIDLELSGTSFQVGNWISKFQHRKPFIDLWSNQPCTWLTLAIANRFRPDTTNQNSCHFLFTNKLIQLNFT